MKIKHILFIAGIALLIVSFLIPSEPLAPKFHYPKPDKQLEDETPKVVNIPPSPEEEEKEKFENANVVD